MSVSDWPIGITTASDDIAAGVCLWRQHRQLYATVAIKATFTLVPGAKMTLRTPLPIERVERALRRGVGIEPGDLAPCLVQPEIWVRGHAWYPPAEGAPSVRVRLALARGKELLLRKNVEIPVRQDPFVAPYLHALAPLSRKWPVRARLLESFAETNLDVSPMELPDTFHWTYFHAAAEDQRLAPLHGDEWVRLEAMHSTMYKFDTQLPSATCVIKMFGRMHPFREGTVVRSGLDTIQIDVDQGTCALVFRGHTALPSNLALNELQFVAGLGLPDRPIPQLEPRWNEAHEGANDLPQVEEDPAILATSFVDGSITSGMLTQAGVLPFQKGVSSLATAPEAPRPREEHDDAGQTFLFDERMLEGLAHQDALPFHESSSASRANVPNLIVSEKPALIAEIGVLSNASITHENGLPLPSGANVVKAPEIDVGSTFFLSADMLAALERKEATPFVGGEVLPERDEEVDMRAGLPFHVVVDGQGDEPGPSGLGAVFLAAMKNALHGKTQKAAHPRG